MARLPETIYPRISQSVPTWQYTGAGNINVSISNITSTGVIDLDIHGDSPLSTVQFEQDLLGTSISGSRAWPNGDIVITQPNTTAIIAYENELTSLIRTAPAKHPIRPYMRASHVVGSHGLGNTGKVGAASSDQAAWKIIRTSVQFETLPYQCLSDPHPSNNIFQEWTRYFSLDDEEQSNEFIKRREGAFTFPPGAGLASGTIPREIAQLTVKKRLRFTWHQLPDDGLFNSGGWMQGGKAPQLDSGLGRVNKYVWHGYNPGTLLLESWKAVQRPMPCEPLAFDVAFDNTDTVYSPSWDVQLQFLYFEPNIDRAYYSNIGESVSLNVFGHNCAPNPKGNNMWYRFYVQGAADTEQFWRYQTYNFNWLFGIWR